MFMSDPSQNVVKTICVLSLTMKTFKTQYHGGVSMNNK